MTLKIFTQSGLHTSPSAGDDPALLLEGAWDNLREDPNGAPRWDLDQLIDVGCSWVDDEATRLAGQLASTNETNQAAREPITLAYVNALALRYYLVKLLRPVAMYEHGLSPAAYRTAELHATRDRDEDYAAVFGQLWRLHGVDGRVVWHAGATPAEVVFAHNATWRQGASWFNRATAPAGSSNDAGRPRIVLCGNPRILDPVCEELLRRGCRVWWLYDRFAVRSWLRWRRRGVGQLVCDASRGRENRLPGIATQRGTIYQPLWSRGVDLAPAVEAWLSHMAATRGPSQTRLVEQLTAHFDRVAPTHVVLDEDATPLARCAVAVGRRVSAVSSVVQNAATGVRFGFVPLVADQVCAWGETSRRQYERWGVPRARIKVTGSSWHDVLLGQMKPSPEIASRQIAPHIVVFMTPPARDSRPDLVAYHKTSRTYRQMLEWVCGSLSTLPQARVTFKLHPRRAGREGIEKVLGEYPSLRVRLVHQAPLAAMLKEASCVVSLGSSAGVEAALAGVPVVQVLPQGSGNFLPASQWGMIGTARSQAELNRLLNDVLAAPATTPSPDVFANLNGTASADIVNAVLAVSNAAEIHGDSSIAGQMIHGVGRVAA